MLLTKPTLRGIRDGSISLQFRRWKRPTVKAGGALLTPIGRLSIEAVDEVEADTITEAEAVAAGFDDIDSLRSALSRGTGRVYRVRLRLAGPDPRIALRQRRPDAAEVQSIVQRLDRLDARSTHGPWTRAVLRLIGRRPGERAAALAESIGMDRDRFKVNVRKLKGLGLTESLEVGYRLSPRGEQVLNGLPRDPTAHRPR